MTLVRSNVDTQQAYVITKGTEDSNPSLVEEALRIHASGYLSMGFLERAAVTKDGFVDPDIDRSRGETTEYYIAVNSVDASDRATLRKVGLRPGGSVTEFDCYKLCEEALFPGGVALLRRITSGSQPVVEISALARTPQASPATVLYLLRAAVRDGLARNEMWFCALVVSTYESLVRHMGPGFMNVLGADVAIEDGRVSSKVALRPVTINLVTCLDSMLVDYGLATGRARARLGRSLLFFSETLDDSMLSAAVAAFRAGAQ